MVIVTRWTSYSQRTGRYTVDSAYIFQQVHFDDEREMWVTKALTVSDSVEITQDVSWWYRECQSCRKKSPLQLLRSTEHDLCGRLGFIHTKPTAWKLLLESDSSALRRGSCAITKITKITDSNCSSCRTNKTYKVICASNYLKRGKKAICWNN